MRKRTGEAAVVVHRTAVVEEGDYGLPREEEEARRTQAVEEVAELHRCLRTRTSLFLEEG